MNKNMITGIINQSNISTISRLTNFEKSNENLHILQSKKIIIDIYLKENIKIQ